MKPWKWATTRLGMATPPTRSRTAASTRCLNWFCLLGAMEELGRKPDRSTFIETWAFVSPVVFAYYLP